MLKDNKEYLSEVYEKINNRLKTSEIKHNKKLNFKTATTVIASTIIVLGTSLTVYAALGGTIGGKPILDWFGIDFSDHYSEYVVPIQNESIETNGAKLSLINTVCDDGFITFEFDLFLDEKAKSQLGNIKKLDWMSDAESLVISFNERAGISAHNNYIQIDGNIYDISSSKRHQQVFKISDYEYKIYQMYFLTDRELQGKTDFTVTLDNISIVNMNETKDFKTRVRSYKKEPESIEDLLYKSGSNQTIDDILKNYDDNSSSVQIKNDPNISDDFKVMLESAWYSDGNLTLADTQTGLKTFIKNYKTKGSTIEDILKENGLEEDLETILSKYSDDITIDELREEYTSDYDNVSKELSPEDYSKAIEKIDIEMSPERKSKRKEIFTLILLYDEAEGRREKDIIMDDKFDINLSKYAILEDTSIIPQDTQTVSYKKMNINIDKVTVTPIQTIITLTSTINNASSNSLTNTYNEDYIGLLGYNVYDIEGNLLANHQFQQKRTLILDNGKTIEWFSSDGVNKLKFNNATMLLKNYITVKTDENLDSIKIVPYVQESAGNNHLLNPLIIKLK